MSRRTRYTGKYKLSKHEFLNAYHYALRYQEWTDEYKALSDTVKAVTYENADMPHGEAPQNPTEDAAIKRENLMNKIRLINETVFEADSSIYPYLLKAVTNENVTYAILLAEGIPCGKDYYYDRRRKFYFLLSQRI